MLRIYLPFPINKDEWKKQGAEFDCRWKFHNCLGVIDRKHIAIKKPPNSWSFYYNYKKFFSIVLMAMVDANYEFIMVDVGTKGRVSDGALSEDELNLPKPICPSP